MKKLLFSSLCVLVCCIGNEVPAQAQVSRIGNAFCKQIEGFDMCVTPGRFQDYFTISKDAQDIESGGITCSSRGWEYESRGDLTEQNMNDFAAGYCRARGVVH